MNAKMNDPNNKKGPRSERQAARGSESKGGIGEIAKAKKKKKKQKPVRHLDTVIASNPELSFAKAVNDGAAMPVSYVPCHDKVLDEQLAAKLIERLVALAEEHRLVEISLFSTANPEWESPGGDGRVDIPRINKAKREIMRSAPNSISRLVWVHAPGEDRSGYLAVPTWVTIEWTIEGQAIAPASPRANSRKMPQARGIRPVLARLNLLNPHAEMIADVVAQFIKAGATLRSQARTLVPEESSEAWAASAAHRAISVAQFGTLLPAVKAIFGAGDGEALVKHAMIQPAARAKQAKRGMAAHDRDDVVDIWWSDALKFAPARMRPLFVKL